MCELKVVLNDKIVFEDCIYATQEEKNVILKDISGFSKGVLDVIIKEINIGLETLTLESIGKG